MKKAIVYHVVVTIPAIEVSLFESEGLISLAVISMDGKPMSRFDLAQKIEALAIAKLMETRA